MKKWVENKEPYGAVVHTLVFGHHGDDPKVIVALFRDSEGDWFTTSNVLDTYWDLLTGKEMCEHDAKMIPYFMKKRTKSSGKPLHFRKTGAIIKMIT